MEVPPLPQSETRFNRGSYLVVAQVVRADFFAGVVVPKLKLKALSDKAFSLLVDGLDTRVVIV